ncbi:hypothetical protein JIN84_16245 [Luteolibacter yonseiensis]|uniref:Uncharacterized protein n=1 Tax=Luteolibacter yonseiensis TaxID=1144680 RepID=A0A934R6A6_9BACT|nr:hypothetical protein [Luteolibacter yonseiensis]MBK1817172.1 hypothetical protein [Luteolibacter yonseiensis]
MKPRILPRCSIFQFTGAIRLPGALALATAFVTPLPAAILVTGSNSPANADWEDGAVMNGTIGDSGIGTLTLDSGSTLGSSSATIGSGSNGKGTATVSGINSAWQNSGNLFLGSSATGILTIETGAKVVTNGNSFVGYMTGGNGTATVNGTNSLWQNTGNLFLGQSGTAVLKIEAGGKVSNFHANINSGSATVTGTGSLWQNTGSLDVGFAGTAALNIENGGKVSNSGTNLGFRAGSSGSLTVTGTGSLWENSGSVIVGFDGTGILKIEDGGKVTTTHATIGFNSGSNGTATVKGIGSVWQNDGMLSVGNDGTGILKIEDGGKFTSDLATIGNHGTLSVTGAGSLWESTRDLMVGSGGTGTLKIEAGGRVVSPSAYVGFNAGDVGIVTVSGAGSIWRNEGDLILGFGGSGILNIEAGGVVSVGDGLGNLDLARDFSDPSALNIGNNNAPGQLMAAEVTSTGDAAVNFNHTAASYNFTTKISGSAAVNQIGTGTTTLGSVNTYAGTTRVTGGKLIITGSINGSTGIIVNDAELELAAGNILKDSAYITLENASLITRGNRETMGALTGLAGANLLDLKSVGNILHFADSSSATWTDSLTILDWTGKSSGGGADQVFFGSNAAGLTPAQLAKITFLNPTINGTSFPGIFVANMLSSGEIVAIPESSTGLLVICSILGLGVRRRR